MRTALRTAAALALAAPLLASAVPASASSTYIGTVDLYEYTDDEFPEEPTVQDVPFEVTLTPTGGTIRSTFTSTYRDHESGVSYRFRETTVTRVATVEGDFDGVPAVSGSVGTFRRSDTTRIA